MTYITETPITTYVTIPRMAKPKTYHFIPPGETDEIQVTNLKAFCADNDLTYSAMRAVAACPDKEKQHEGYRAGPSQSQEAPVTHDTPITLVNDGLALATTHTAVRPTLAKQSGISAQSIWRMLTGKADNGVRGWRIVKDINDVPSDYARANRGKPDTPVGTALGDTEYDPAEEDL